MKQIINSNNNMRKSTGSMFSSSNKPSFDDILMTLTKDMNSRTRTDIRLIGKFLYDNYDYFRKMKDSSEQGKYDKMISVLHYEYYKENANIINFGEIGDKAYVLLKGKIGIYKPRDIEQRMSFEDFEAYVNQIRLFEGNMAKYKRLVNKNDHIDLFSIFSSKQRIYQCIIEEEDLLGTFDEGFNFGDIALLKKAPRNATVKSLDKSHLVSIDQFNYNEILRELEEKRLEKDLELFKSTYQMFKPWSNNNLLHLFNNFQRISLLQGDYLYKQNDHSDCIYIIQSGEFEVYSIINFEWVNDFIKYILYSKTNILETLKDLKGYKSDSELKIIFTNQKEENVRALGPSPCQATPVDALASIHLSKYPKQDSLIKIKLNEEKSNKQSFKVKLRKVNQKEVLGYEDGIELKNRFTSVKCISSEAIVEKVLLFDLYRLLYNLDESDRSLFTKTISIRKLCLINLIQNASKIKARIIEDRYTEKYNAIIQNQHTDEPTKRLAMKFRKSNNIFKQFLSLKRTKSMNLVMPPIVSTKGKNILINTQIKLFPTLVPNVLPPETEKSMRKSLSFLSTPFGSYYTNYQKSKRMGNYEKSSNGKSNTKEMSCIKDKENIKTQSIINWKNQTILLSTLSPQSLQKISFTTREITKINPFESSYFSIKKKNVFSPSSKEVSICKNALSNRKKGNNKQTEKQKD